LSIGETKQVLR